MLRRKQESDRQPTCHGNRLTSPLLPHLAMAFLLVLGAPVKGQDSSSASDAKIIERFTEVLIRQPRLGVAFDRVYAHHADQGTIEQWIKSLVDGDDESGAAAMLHGMIQQRRHDLTAARDAFAKAAKLRPGDPLVCEYYAGVLEATGEVDAAIKQLQEALSRNPSRLDAVQVSMGLAKLQFKVGNADQADATIDELLSKFNRSQAVLEKVASLLDEVGQPERAIAVYQQMIEQTANDEKRVQYQLHVAQLHEQIGETTNAKELLKTLLVKLRPGSWLYRDASESLERLYFANDQVDELVEYYTSRLLKRPDDLPLAIRLGQIKWQIGELQEAEDLFRQVLQRSPQSLDAGMELVELLVSSGRHSDAIIELQRHVDEKPSNIDLALRLGDLHLQTQAEDKVESAAAVFNRAAKVHADNPVHLVTIAGKMKHLDRQERAIELYRQAIELDPESAQYREYLGEYLHRLDRKDEAVQTWWTIAEGSRRSRESLIRVAEVFRTFEYRDDCLQAWEEAKGIGLETDQHLRYCQALIGFNSTDKALDELDTLEKTATEASHQDQVMRLWIQVQVQTRRLDAAIVELIRQPKTVKTTHQLALLYHESNQPEFALENIRMALSLAPENLFLLRDSAAIYEAAQQTAQTIKTLEKLVRLDASRSSSYLRKLVLMHRSGNQWDAAIDAAEQLVRQNPSSLDGYHLLADVQRGADLHDDSEATVRRSLAVAPNSITSLRLLADRLGEKYDTREAIELLWKAIELEASLQSRIEMVQQLVPLYERRDELDELMRRLQLIRRGKSTDYPILVASVWRFADQSDRGKTILMQAVENQPNHSELLRTIVDLCIETEDFALAVEYYTRYVRQHDTPENQIRLIQLKAQAGMMTELEAAIAQLDLNLAPSQVGLVLKDALRKDRAFAIDVCKKILEQSPEDWAVKTCLMQLSLPRDQTAGESDFDRVLTLATEIEGLSLAPHVAASPLAQRSGPQASSGANWPKQRWLDWLAASNRQLFRRAGGSTNSRSSVRYTIRSWSSNAVLVPKWSSNQAVKSINQPIASVVLPQNFFEAVWIGRLMRVMVALERRRLQKSDWSNAELMAREFPADFDRMNVDQLRDHAQLYDFAQVLTSSEFDVPETLTWRLAELDPTGDQSNLVRWLNKRAEERTSRRKLDPLTGEQLDLLLHLCRVRHVANLEQVTAIASVYGDMLLRQRIIAEMRLAGRENPFLTDDDERAVESKEIAIEQKILLLVSEFQLAVEEGNTASAERQLAKLLAALRSTSGSIVHDPNPLWKWITSIESDVEFDFIASHQREMLDVILAMAAHQRPEKNKTMSVSKTLGAERSQIVLASRRSETQKRVSYSIFELPTPLSNRLIDVETLRMVLAVTPTTRQTSLHRQARLSEELIEYLSEPDDELSNDEAMLRRVTAAYVLWWMDRPDRAYAQFQQIAEDYRDDFDLQIAVARLAVVNQNIELGFRILDAAPVSRSVNEIVRDYARVVLASTAEDKTALELAATELLQGTYDIPTLRILANRIKPYRSSNQVVAQVYRALSAKTKSQGAARISSGRVQLGEESEIAVARTHLKAGDLMTAAEVAYSVIKNHPAYQTADNNPAFIDAVEILQQTGKTEPLLTALKAKHARQSDVNSVRSLTNLLLLTDHVEEAERYWREFLKSQDWPTTQVIDFALKQLQHEHPRQAAILFRIAFEQEPSFWNRHWYQFSDAVRSGELPGYLSAVVKDVPLESLQSDTLLGLLRISDSISSEQQESFADRLIDLLTEREVPVPTILASVSSQTRNRIDEFKGLVLNSISAPESFQKDAEIWAMVGWDSTGKVIGILANALELMCADEKASQRFVRVAEQAIAGDDESKVAIAQLLLDLHRLSKHASKPSTDPKVIESLAKTFPVQVKSIEAGAQSPYPPSLIWQAAQYVDDSLGDTQQDHDIRVGMYQMAVRSAPPFRMHSSVVRVPSDLLLHAYHRSGRTRLAVDGWLARLNESIVSATVGTAEDRQLRLVGHVSEQLVNIGNPVEAAILNAESLQKKLLFNLASRHSPLTDHRQILETQLRRSVESITTDHAVVFLSDLAEELRSGAEQSLRLNSVALQISLDRRSDGIFEHVCRLAYQRDDGSQVMDELHRVLAKRSQSQTSAFLLRELQLNAAELVLACWVDRDSLAIRLDQLLSTLPSAEHLSSSRRTFEGYQTLYQTAAAIRRAKCPNCEASLERLLTFLRTIVTARGRDEEATNVLWLSRTSESLTALLEIYDEQASEDEATARLMQQFDIAELAAQCGRWDVVAKAIKMTLGGGIDLNAKIRRNMTKVNVRDVHGGQADVSSTVGLEDEITHRLISIFEHIQDADGRPLTNPDCRLSIESTEESVVKELYDAIGQAIIPSDLVINLFPYAMVQRVDKSDGSRLNTHSLAFAWFNLSERLGLVKEIESQLLSLSRSTRSHQVQSLKVGQAIVCGDSRQLLMSITSLNHALQRQRYKVHDVEACLCVLIAAIETENANDVTRVRALAALQRLYKASDAIGQRDQRIKELMDAVKQKFGDSW
ncbi:tetratricopeptide repeat protein [Roseiconus lacunae]|uniref:tetratricopeptide repeat protein n=1 Tax=Roseiconus lacunae TaxID=2605694 RepID=UPI0011F24542|nr:tetratricopeptide repeat protein [Roseiconus lacunae]